MKTRPAPYSRPKRATSARSAPRPTVQAVLNVAVVTNTIPNTGISLPFFSSGGTSLMMLLGEMGVVLGVSRGEM